MIKESEIPLNPNTNPSAFKSFRWFNQRALVRFLGSLKLAMILLAIIIIACISGTLIESQFNTSVAQVYIYDAPWFIAWLIMLCVNVIGAVLVRRPLKARQTGFVITHAGIVTLLIGAIIGKIWGVEGNITLHKGTAPSTHLVMDRKVFEVENLDTREKQSRILSAGLPPPTQDRPFILRLKQFKVSLLGYAEELGVIRSFENVEQGGAPAVHVIAHSSMVPQPIDQWLVLGDPDKNQAGFGPLQIQFLPDTTHVQHEEKHRASERTHTEPSRERHFVFAKMPEMNLASAIIGQPTGVKAYYHFSSTTPANKNDYGILEVQFQDKRFEFSDAAPLKKPVPFPGTPWKIKILGYFPDFRMDRGKPISISNEPNNPALMFEILGPPVNSVNTPPTTTGIPSMHPSIPTQPLSPNRLLVFYNPAGKFRYEATSSKHGATQGIIELGKEFQPGFADWRFSIQEKLDHAVIHEEVAPLSEKNAQPLQTSGVLVQMENHGRQWKRWIRMGTPEELEVDGQRARISFDYQLHPLNFEMALDHFEVERDEGTENPASFKSYVRFIDPHTQDVVHREIWMNHPSNFPDFPGVGLLGIAYKFSQASWNPEDLNQTTLQVLRDPGWLFKWMGSLMICGGIFTMFYLTPYFSSKKEIKS